MSNESLPTTSDTDQTEPITDKEMIRSLVRDEIEAWWTSGRSVDALKRAELKSGGLEARLRRDWGLPPRSRTLPGSSATDAESDQDRHARPSSRLGRRFLVPLPGEPVDKSRKARASSPLARRMRALADYRGAVGDLTRHANNFDLFDSEGLLAEWVASNAVRVVGLNETLVGLYSQIGLVVDQQPNVAAVGKVEQHERVVVSDAMTVLVTDSSHEDTRAGLEVAGGVGDSVESFEQSVGDVVDVVSGVEFVPDAAVDENAGHETSPSVGGCGDHSVGETGPAEDSVESSAGTEQSSRIDASHLRRTEWKASLANANLKVSEARLKVETLRVAFAEHRLELVEASLQADDREREERRSRAFANRVVALGKNLHYLGLQIARDGEVLLGHIERQELTQAHRTSPSVGERGSSTVGDGQAAEGLDDALRSRSPGDLPDQLVDEYARVFLDGASEWWRQDDPHCTPAPMTPAVTSGIRRVLERVEAERAVSALASDGMDESGHVVWRSVAGANVYARPRVVKLHQRFGKFTPGGARRLAAALIAAADVAEGRR
ncbi:hypothetical protein [Rhodococcus pyridinivorans]|uniref:hypothetical protein n=1 Tax=Rhodococcus pyridinivorans TaxID=103816 RepID=UPI0012FE4E17|nr:hypothetical protein [Rhodococcus pyridinivorans]